MPDLKERVEMIKLMVLADSIMVAREEMQRNPIVDSGEWIFINSGDRWRGLDREIPFVMVGNAKNDKTFKHREMLLGHGYKEYQRKLNTETKGQ